MHFTIGDHPAPVAIEPASVDLDDFTAADAELVQENGVTIPVGAALLGEVVEVDLPLLGVAGRHELRVVMSAPGVTQSLLPLPVIVEHEDGGGWYTIAAARHDWSGAPSDDGRLHDLLVVARHQCLEYAPTLAADAPIPTRYRQAQLMQARNIWNASKTDPGATTLGPEGFAAPVFPLDWSVQQMLRPRRGKPVIG
ncbi:hypothetical protein [Agrococcus jejuensis]|uniref:hypothetical protein n=1 Tax=Agrococcus jejuensis TaxID=399736 RepID=UPI0011A4F2BB|nr:hypothetical protein [Agrococcus jejuensis]